MHLCPHILSVLVRGKKKKMKGGEEQEEPPRREECETLLEGKIGPSIALSRSRSAGLCVAHKGSRQAARNQFHGAGR